MRLHRVNLIDSDPKICQALFADKKKNKIKTLTKDRAQSSYSSKATLNI